MTKDGPVAQNGMVKVGDTLVSVGGECIKGLPELKFRPLPVLDAIHPRRHTLYYEQEFP